MRVIVRFALEYFDVWIAVREAPDDDATGGLKFRQTVPPRSASSPSDRDRTYWMFDH
jgi:hypothetical protein